ncbi:MAG: DUF2029 domain-containing protein [Verrucomicrobia bacterium]|nr:DUF2029 domain-containing protein [Verrucomicrobiota bacterium]
MKPRNTVVAALKGSPWLLFSSIVWAAALAVVMIRSATGYHRTIAFINFRQAGLNWTTASNLYTNWRGFVYSPLIAALFAPLTYLPWWLGIVLWQFFNAAVLLGGVALLLHTIGPPEVKKHEWIVYLLILPFALGNLDIGHSNPLLAGILALSVAAVSIRYWWFSASCIALATALKIYPLAIGLLICVIAPRHYTWRLLISLSFVAIAPFLLQHWPYVAAQYHAWIGTRQSDDRLNYPLKYAPLDLWFLLHWIGHIHLPPLLYSALQVAGGAAIAWLCWWSGKKNWALQRRLLGLFSLGNVWMMLLGPATEGYTYLLLAPAMIIAGIHLSVRRSRMALLGLFPLLLQLFALARISFLPNLKPLWIFAIQPVSTIVFLVISIGWLNTSRLWEHRESGERG